DAFGECLCGIAPRRTSAFGDRLQAVTLEQVNQALQELIDPDHLVIVTAGPAVSFNP
ncbi:MAG TPA: hypothetical protein IGP91_11755, partial [Thermosynechococcus sp. M46_R2017_013]|nr:hypothetical protein [Thermosynechococcus sp. M46_R2017_013]